SAPPPYRSSGSQLDKTLKKCIQHRSRDRRHRPISGSTSQRPVATAPRETGFLRNSKPSEEFGPPSRQCDDQPRRQFPQHQEPEGSESKREIGRLVNRAGPDRAIEGRQQ